MYLFDYDGRQVFNATSASTVLFAVVTSEDDFIAMCNQLNLAMNEEPSAGVYYFDDVQGVVYRLECLNTPTLICGLMELQGYEQGKN